MEQLRKIMQWLKRHHFWVLSVVAALVPAAAGHLSARTLRQQLAANQAKIEAAFRKQDEIARKEFHPNAQINEEQGKQIALRVASVADTWRHLYERQRAEELKWPQKELGQTFCDAVDQLKFGDDIPLNLRQKYRDYINLHFPELPAIVKARVVEGGSAGSRGGGRPAENFERREPGLERSQGLFADQALDDDYICEWSDQQAVRDLLLFEDTPSPLKVWVTQEDVWAYRTMLEVIAKTNASVGADRPSNAAVRVIEALEVGQAAAEFSRTTGRITLAPEVTAVAAPAGTEEAATGARPDVGGGDFERGREGEGGPTLEQERVLLLSKRYIDRQGKPIPFEGTSTNYQTAFGPEYKRLPVRTVLRMDWRKVNFLISECANQPLQVEVQEVRKNPLDGGAGSGSFYNTRRTSGDSMRGGPGTFRSGSIPTFPVNPHLSTVVIQGVIYIFNEPNQAVLQVTSVNAVGP